MYYPGNGQRSYKPQTKHAERMLLPRCLQKYIHERTFEYTGAEKQMLKKSDFVIFFLLLLLLPNTKLLTSMAYKLQQLLSYFTHRTASLLS